MAVKSPAVKEILERYRTIWALNHAQSLMGWDREVYMPEEGIGGRSLAASEIAKLTQKLMLDESFVKLIDKAKEEDLTDVEKGMIRMLERDLKFYRRVPPEIVAEFAKTTSEAFVAWRAAKEKADFKKFAPYLGADSGARQGHSRQARIRRASLRRPARSTRGGPHVAGRRLHILGVGARDKAPLEQAGGQRVA
jgi:carboxypeptidase Pfu. Metallo peptidase. MEROPS family M32